MSVDSKMTAIANAIRSKTGGTAVLSLDEMADAISSISTGVGLNFDVVGSTTAPTSPKENTIWVNTSTPVTGYYFASTQPENMAEGAVWFFTDTRSAVAFNALQENNIQVYPLDASQIVNGQIVDVVAKTYQNGAWVDWYRGELYDNGHQCESITGGWTAHTQNGTTYTLGDNSIQFGGGGSGTIYTNLMVDMSGYTTLYAEVTVTNTGENVALGLSSKNTTINADYRVVEKTLTKPYTQKHTIEVDISNINESYYVHFTCWKSGGTIHKIWRERGA